MAEIIIGTRSSQLATTQTKLVVDQLATEFPEHQFKLQEITTKGDQVLDKALAEIGGKGLFIKEIEVALLEEEIDLAVHSLKDMPSDLADQFEIAAIPKRSNPLDVLISNGDKSLDQLPEGAKIGTGSLRRKSQLLNYRSDLEVVPIRGNIDTRLKKLATQDLDAIVLAASGLLRMGWEDKITHYLDPVNSLPAVGQGALAIETRAGDERIKEILTAINDPVTTRLVTAERSFLARLDGNCKVPIGAYAQLESGKMLLTGMVGRTDGTKLIREQLTGELDQATELGNKLADKLIKQGAKDILAEAREE
jgi:hydroxymethylbilane synthase